jgi:hypothetical protein
MIRGRRVWVVVGVCGLAAVAAVYGAQQASKRRIESQVRNGPLTIAVSEGGGNAQGSSWRLHVDSAGKASLEMDTYPTPKSRQFVVTKAQLEELRKALLRERFFELADAYGEHVPDGGTTNLQVSAGEVTKSVELHFFGNWLNSDHAKLREPSRAIEVLQIILGWFDDPLSVAGRKYNRRLLDAAKTAE